MHSAEPEPTTDTAALTAARQKRLRNVGSVELLLFLEGLDRRRAALRERGEPIHTDPWIRGTG